MFVYVPYLSISRGSGKEYLCGVLSLPGGVVDKWLICIYMYLL